MKNYTKSEQNHAKYPMFTQNFNPWYLLEKKTKFKNIFLVSNFTLDVLFNDTIRISVRWIYRSAKIVWKKPLEYIIPPPTSADGTIMWIWSV